MTPGTSPFTPWVTTSTPPTSDLPAASRLHHHHPPPTHDDTPIGNPRGHSFVTNLTLKDYSIGSLISSSSPTHTRSSAWTCMYVNNNVFPIRPNTKYSTRMLASPAVLNGKGAEGKKGMECVKDCHYPTAHRLKGLLGS